MALYSYSARNVTISIVPVVASGLKPHTVTGFGEDEFLTVELNDDDYTTVEGADGMVVRSHKPNKIAKATLTLQQTSASNGFLELLRNADKVVGAGLFSLTVSTPVLSGAIIPDSFSGTNIFSAQSFITKMANYTYGKESGERAWDITLVDASYSMSAEIEALIKGGIDVARGVAGMVSAVQ